MKPLRRRIIVGLIGAMTLVGPVGGAGGATASPGLPKTDTGKVKIEEDFADPGVVKGEDGLWYAFSSQTDLPEPAAARVPVARSVGTDPAGEWQSLHDASGARTDALPDAGAWTAPVDRSRDAPQLWAPDVSPRPAGGYLMLYSALPGTRDEEGHCVGMATADHLGPNVHFDAAPAELFCGPDGPDGRPRGVIDPAVFVDTDGSRYIVYKVEPVRSDDPDQRVPSEIHLRKFVDLGPQGLRWDGGPTKILQADPSFDDPENGQLEAPFLVHHGAHYVLFYSAGWFNNPGYYTGYATSTSLTGGYQKSDTKLLDSDVSRSTGPAHPAHDVPRMSRTSAPSGATRPLDGCVPGNANQLSGPGGATVFSRADRDYIAYHGIWTCDGGQLRTRALYVDRLAWTTDDTPYIEAG
ncbi:glycoside hydrolase family 43 protein [Streptomyces sp. CT34]|uniref:glycoside hydrolase family 43 protein n=1 Tax=Streptomyces sp. CT34 TaxID=1553907 RepID=UPI0005BCDAF3|nr:glycoside hydrolase family 43 protein [Streptomyces sp. CT34]